MDPLATSDDLVDRLGRDLSDLETPRAAALLADASARFRFEARQQISESSSTARLRVDHGRIDLPQYPVTAVTAVRNDANTNIDVQWSTPSSWIYVGSVDRFDLDYRTCEYLNVTYTHGFDPVPDIVIAVICQMAGRALGVTLESTAITGEGLGAYNYTVGGAAAAGGFGMLPIEIELARSFRKPARPLSML